MMMMKTNLVRPAPNPTYSSYFHPIWMIWKIRNMVRTHWELKGNTVGTHMVNQGKMRKIPHPTPSPPKTSKEKIQATLVASWAFPLASAPPPPHPTPFPLGAQKNRVLHRKIR